MIDAWTQDARPLALLYQEGLAAMPGAGPVAVWTAAWRDFWIGVAIALDLSETDGRLLHLFFESEALYNLSTWSPALERAALREMCQHIAVAYLGAAATAWPTGALEEAERASGVLREGAGPAVLGFVRLHRHRREPIRFLAERARTRPRVRAQR